MKKTGMGVIDSPFMLAITAVSMVIIVWIGSTALQGFLEANNYKKAADAMISIYKSARELSISYDGSSDTISVNLPNGYLISTDGGILSLISDKTVNGSSQLALASPTMALKGLEISSDPRTLEGMGLNLTLTYDAKDKRINILQ